MIQNIFNMLQLYKVLYIFDGCCIEFNIYYFILYKFWVTNDSEFQINDAYWKRHSFEKPC